MLYGLLFLLLSIPTVKRQVTLFTAKELSTLLNASVSLRDASPELFNKVILRDVVVTLNNGADTILTANKLGANLELMPLLSKRLVINNIQLFSFNLRLGRDSLTSPLNINPIIEKLKPKNKSDKGLVELQLRSILLRRGKFNYNVKSEPETPNVFNKHHIAVENLLASVSLRTLSGDTINSRVKRFSFVEKSGFELRKIAFEMIGNRDSVSLTDFEFALPNSYINLAPLTVDMSDLPNDRVRKSLFALTKEEIEILADSAYMRFEIRPSFINMRDLSALNPAFSLFPFTVKLQALAKGSINDMVVDKLELTAQDYFYLDANFKMSGLTKWKSAYLFGGVNQLYLTPDMTTLVVNNFTKSSKTITELCDKAGVVQFSGNVSGFYNDFIAKGEVRSDVGSLETKMEIQSDWDKGEMTFEGEVKADKVMLGEMLPENNPFGEANLWVDLSGHLERSRSPIITCQGELFDFDFRGYHYSNVQFQADLKETLLIGKIELNDLNGYLSAQWRVADWKSKSSSIEFKAELSELNSDLLHLTKLNKNTTFTGYIGADLKGELPNAMLGSFVIRDFSLRNDIDTFYVDNFILKSECATSNKLITIESPFMAGSMRGNFNLSNLLRDSKRILSTELPSLFPKKVSSVAKQDNMLDFSIRLKGVEKISKIFNLPITIPQYLDLQGRIDNSKNILEAVVSSPQIAFGSSRLEQLRLSFVQLGNDPRLRLSSTFVNRKKKVVNLTGEVSASSDSIYSRLLAFNTSEETFGGELAWTTKLSRDVRQKMRVVAEVIPTNMILNDTLWKVAPATIVADSGVVRVDGFEISHANQFLRIDGRASSQEGDKLSLSLQSINLDYIFEMINLKRVHFGGIATGDFRLSQFTGIPQISTDNFSVNGFKFNDAILGDLELKSQWNNENKGILMLGDISDDENSSTKVEGYIFPTRDSLNLSFDANRLNVSFIDEFTKTIFSDLSGKATGKVSLFGRFSRLALRGEAYLENTSFGIDYLNSTFTVNDTLFLEPKRFWFKDINIADAKGGRGSASGEITHDGFQNLKYNITLLPQNMLVFNTTSRHNELFHGIVYASGKGEISGDTEVVNISLNGRTEPNSQFTFSLSSSATANEYQFITFEPKSGFGKEGDFKSTNMSGVTLSEPGRSSINIDIQVDVTPEATLHLIMDDVTGDQIKTNGSGALRLTYSTVDDEVKLYGAYEIEKGSYNFNLQNLFNRDFSIQEGSSVTFRGDPMAADLDINAIYSLTANLTDLDESFATDRDLSRTNVPVHCLMNIRGDMLEPDLSFDVALPTNSDDVNRRVKSLIGSPEMLNQQIIYLLLLNKFYTPDYANTGQRNELSAIASSTISAQLNNILRQVSSNWNVGTNIRSDKGDFSDIEVELALSSQLLNNRLLINGNFGYRDNPKSQNNFIGDIDVEYKLTKSGHLRLKGYNKTNDRLSYLKSSLTTQGLGVIYKRDFDNIIRALRARIQKTTEEERE
ncbi:MAG: translocation/assembly module TamB domain-containing protein [Bacteroidales bacterium]